MAGEVFPIGTVLFYVGVFTDNVTMVGWYVCDGSDSAPTMVDHFVRGAAASGHSAAGSDAAVNITHTHDGISERAAHNHIGTTGGSDPASHTHTFKPWVFAAGGSTGAASNMWGSSSSSETTYESDEGSHSHSGDISTAGSHSHTTASSGAAGAGKNMPEYKRAIPIIRLA